MFCGWTDDQILLFNAEINQSYWEDGTIEFIDNEGNEQQTAFYDNGYMMKQTMIISTVQA